MASTRENWSTKCNFRPFFSYIYMEGIIVFPKRLSPTCCKIHFQFETCRSSSQKPPYFHTFRPSASSSNFHTFRPSESSSKITWLHSPLQRSNLSQWLSPFPTLPTISQTQLNGKITSFQPIILAHLSQISKRTFVPRVVNSCCLKRHFDHLEWNASYHGLHSWASKLYSIFDPRLS